MLNPRSWYQCPAEHCLITETWLITEDSEPAEVIHTVMLLRCCCSCTKSFFLSRNTAVNQHISVWAHSKKSRTKVGNAGLQFKTIVTTMEHTVTWSSNFTSTSSLRRRFEIQWNSEINHVSSLLQHRTYIIKPTLKTKTARSALMLLSSIKSPKMIFILLVLLTHMQMLTHSLLIITGCKLQTLLNRSRGWGSSFLIKWINHETAYMTTG